jgi:hypothetical protein
MKRLTIAMMLTLLVAGLAIGCSSAPEAPAAPAAPAPSFSEREVIAIARGSSGIGCTAVSFDTEHQYYGWDDEDDYTFSNFAHSESATFKPNGLWLVRTKTSYNVEAHNAINTINTINGVLPRGKSDYLEFECNVLVDDANGKVRPN